MAAGGGGRPTWRKHPCAAAAGVRAERCFSQGRPPAAGSCVGNVERLDFNVCVAPYYEVFNAYRSLGEHRELSQRGRLPWAVRGGIDIR